MRALHYTYILVILPLVVAGVCFAQADEYGGGAVPLSLITEPKNFSAGESITVRASYFLVDLSRIRFTWFVDGKETLSGTGASTITVAAPEAGEPLNIRVEADAPNGRFLTKSLVLRTASVDIMWEAQTSAPALYKGKTLPSSGSTIKAVAVPHFVNDSGVRFGADELFYEWRVGGRLLAESSGKGRDFITTPTQRLSSKTDILVSVSSPQKTFSAEGRVEVRHIDPEVVLYEKKPLLGIDYSKAVPDTIDFLGGEVSLKAEEYHFAQNPGEVLGISWEIDGEQTNYSGNVFTFLKEASDNFGSTARLRVVVESLENFLQTAGKELVIRF